MATLDGIATLEAHTSAVPHSLPHGTIGRGSCSTLVQSNGLFGSVAPHSQHPSESVARAREPWADTLGTIPLPTDVISEHLDRNLLAVRQTLSTSQYVVSSASELRVYEGGVGAGVPYLHYYMVLEAAGWVT